MGECVVCTHPDDFRMEKAARVSASSGQLKEEKLMAYENTKVGGTVEERLGFDPTQVEKLSVKALLKKVKNTVGVYDMESRVSAVLNRK